MNKPSTSGFFGRMFSRQSGPADDGGSTGQVSDPIERARTAAERGDAIEQNSFGLRFAHGQGVPRSEVEAGKWFRRAAQQGLAEAQFNMGNLVYSALGCQV